MFRRVPQVGTALFMALLVIAIVTSLTIAMVRRQQLEIRRTELMLTSEQAYLYSQGIINWAKGAILQIMANPTATQTWPITLAPTTIAEGPGQISGILQDASGLLNLNNLITIQGQTSPEQVQAAQAPNPATVAPSDDQAATVQASQTTPTTKQQQASTAVAAAAPPGTGANNQAAQANPEYQKYLVNLMAILGVQLPQDQQQLLINALTSWITPGPPTMQNQMDRFDNQYASLTPAYRSPHAPMVGISELRTVAGMTPEAYNRLLPFVIALPTNTTLNPAAAPAEILQATGQNTNTSQTGSSNNATATPNANPATPNAAAPPGAANYYLLRGDVYLEEQHFLIYCVLMNDVDPISNKKRIRVLWQSFGTL